MFDDREPLIVVCGEAMFDLFAALSLANRAAAITCNRFGADLLRKADLAAKLF